jgi:hypothetical protein
MLGKYKITINVEIERANDPDENIVKDEELQIPGEYLNCGRNCDSCGADNSDNEDDNIDYDKYNNGWDYRDNLVLEMVKRDDSGRFAKGNIPTTKRGLGGRFVKSS